MQTESVQALPVIVGFGGYNAAGRSSDHQAFRRIILESLSVEEQQKTIVGLACLMKLVSWSGGSYQDDSGNVHSAAEVADKYRQQVLDGTLIRRLEKEGMFDPEKVNSHKRIDITPHEGEVVTFKMSRRDLPDPIPEHWSVEKLEDGSYLVSSTDSSECLVSTFRKMEAQAAGQLPTGFNPAEHYNARFHPKGLQMALAGASDAVHSIGIPWEKIAERVQPDEVGVYASSILSQLSEEGFGGLLQARLLGDRTTSKQLALGLNTMPADFVNAYVLGSVGHTEAITGACATFLYVLQAAIRDIRNGRRRVAVVGNADAGATPEVMDGFINMGALGSDEGICKLDGSETPDWRRASRPFGENCGFTIAEGSQYMVLMDDALAMELGADIQGAIPDVFINADGIKKSISAPGPGNYISFSKAVATAIAIVGEDSVKNHSFIHAHGSSTPQNRVTESEIFDRVAKAFDISDWPVTAVKAYVGHTLATASGDQVVSALGTFKYNIIPGIKTITEVASDVYQDRVVFPLQDMDVSANKMDIAFINSKGFGGNNATAIVLSPDKVDQMLAKRYGEQFADYQQRREQTRKAVVDYAERADRAELDIIYRFGEALIDQSSISISVDRIHVPGFAQDVIFDKNNPWQDMS